MAYTKIGAADNRQQIIVVGAGIVDMACVLQLRRDGHQITLLDQAGIGESCSFDNTGCLSVASVVPMALPSMLRQVSKWLADPMDPLAVCWHCLPRALPWLLQWVFAGNETQTHTTAQPLASLFSTTFPGYQNLLDATQYNGLIRQTGHLYVQRTLARSLGDVLTQSVRDTTGVRLQALSADEACELEPALAADIQSGLLLLDNGFMVSPERLVKTLAANFAAAGGTFLRRKMLDVESGQNNYDGPTRLYTDCGALSVSKSVLCVGAWSMRLGAKLTSIRIPPNAERGHYTTLRAPSMQLSRPIMDYERKLIATPMEDDLCIAGIVKIGGLGAASGCRRTRIPMRQGQQLFPGLDFTDDNQWMGHRPSPPDNLPVIDRSEHYRSVFFAFGHGHLGMAGAPGTVRPIADLINERTPFINGRPCGLQWFRQRQPRQEPGHRPHRRIVHARHLGDPAVWR